MENVEWEVAGSEQFKSWIDGLKRKRIAQLINLKGTRGLWIRVFEGGHCEICDDRDGRLRTIPATDVETAKVAVLLMLR